MAGNENEVKFLKYRIVIQVEKLAATFSLIDCNCFQLSLDALPNLGLNRVIEWSVGLLISRYSMPTARIPITRIFIVKCGYINKQHSTLIESTDVYL